MLSIVAKCLLVSTSLSPVLLTLAVNQLERGRPWATSYWLALAALLLAASCKELLRYAQENAQRHLLYVKEFENREQEMLTFLFIYLLPFVRGSTFASEWITSVFVLSIITAAIATTGAFHFNPVMRLLFRYRFYGVKNRRGVSCLLISKVDLRRPDRSINTVRLAHGVYLHTERTHA